MRSSSVLPHARCVSSWSSTVPASAYARAPLWHGDTLCDASLSVRRSFPYARLRRAVVGAGGAARHGRRSRHCTVLAPRHNLLADVPGAAAAPRCRAARPPPADDVARLLCRGYRWSRRRHAAGLVCRCHRCWRGGGGAGQPRQRTQPYTASSNHCDRVSQKISPFALAIFASV